jgi:hypothetical protein
LRDDLASRLEEQHYEHGRYAAAEIEELGNGYFIEDDCSYISDV